MERKANSLRNTCKKLEELGLWASDMGGGTRCPDIEGYSWKPGDGFRLGIPDNETQQTLYWSVEGGLAAAKKEEDKTTREMLQIRGETK